MLNYKNKIKLGIITKRLGIVSFIIWAFLGWSGLNINKYLLFSIFAFGLILIFISIHFTEDEVEEKHEELDKHKKEKFENKVGIKNV